MTVARPRLGSLIVALATALLLAPIAAAHADDDGPELDKQRVATCEARGGRLARNHQGQMLCKDAKVKLKAWLEQHPEAKAPATAAAPAVAPAPGVTAPPPGYAPGSVGTHTVQGGAPMVPPATPIDAPGGGSGGGSGGAQGGGGKPPVAPLPPALQTPKKVGASCYLRACLYSAYTKRCDCHEYDSAELCRFKETTIEAPCADANGMTTALCPAGTSCVNNRCKTVCN